MAQGRSPSLIYPGWSGLGLVEDLAAMTWSSTNHLIPLARPYQFSYYRLLYKPTGEVLIREGTSASWNVRPLLYRRKGERETIEQDVLTLCRRKMKQKITIKVPMCTDKVRREAMKTATKQAGVISIELQGDKDLLVVVGEGVDSVELTRSLRKKIGCSMLVSVEEVKPKPPDEKKKVEDPQHCNCKDLKPCCVYPQPCGVPMTCWMECEPPRSGPCSQM
ncbi:hypothetical protein Taro_033702 [Colocasia esculenta]|uniref:HMA domain-containing protein n=1 Tax=Colocasia esculenta TaxID=4460 RepID=A0A843VYM7_COLES|nr:hypothetical protein [Colocasia esculenta]